MCNFRPKTFAQAEMGCPLDHAPCGAHVVEGDKHEESCKVCKELQEDHVEDPIRVSP